MRSPRIRRPIGRGELLRYRLAAVAAIVLVPTVVMWKRQSPDALLGGSFGDIAGGVTLFSVMTIAVVLVRLRSRLTILLGGSAATAVLAWIWARAARDWHSTASWGPGLFGWFLVPGGLLALSFAEDFLSHGLSGRTPDGGWDVRPPR